MDMAQMQERIRALEARREKGEPVPELDALYRKMDAMTEQGYKTATEGEAKPKTQKKAAGGYVKSADGCAQRGKTRGRMV